MKKIIPLPLAILIIVICVGLAGWITVTYYLEMPRGEEKITEIKPSAEQPKAPYLEVTNNEIKIIGTYTYIFFDKTELMQVAGTSKWPDSSETYINRAKERIG